MVHCLSARIECMGTRRKKNDVVRYYLAADSLYSAIQMNGQCAVYFSVIATNVVSIDGLMHFCWPFVDFPRDALCCPLDCSRHVAYDFNGRAFFIHFFNFAFELIRIVEHKDLCVITTLELCVGNEITGNAMNNVDKNWNVANMQISTYVYCRHTHSHQNAWMEKSKTIK